MIKNKKSMMIINYNKYINKDADIIKEKVEIKEEKTTVKKKATKKKAVKKD